MVLEPEELRIFVKLNIPALKYDRDMDIEAANIFIEFIKGKHQDIKLCDFDYLLMKHSLTEFCCVHVVKRLVWKSNTPI